MIATYGIRNRETGLWFSGFGPAPEYHELWAENQNEAISVGTKEFTEAQAYLLSRSFANQP